MSSDIAISIKGASKCYKIYNRPQDRLKQSLWRGKKQFYREFWALRDVSFDVKKGETIGIIGRNGSGKSTILQIIAGTLSPSKGEVKVNGRVAALLELGSGFNPEFTGKENVFLNGAILGISYEEMEQRFEEIVTFSEIAEFIDQPVKTYSSGMFARLAFAVAINVDPDILIVDEALSVGDIKFQLKCIDKMKQIRDNGTTILFVSHATEQVKRFCTKAIWIDKGEVKVMGDANDVVNIYEDYLHLEIYEEKKEDPINPENRPLEVKSIEKLGRIKQVKTNQRALNTFDTLSVTIDYQIFVEQIPNFLLGVAIYDRGRNYIFGPNTYLDKVQVPNSYGEHRVVYSLPKIPLLSGTYFLDVGIFTDSGLVCIDYSTNADSFTLNSEYFTEGLVHLEHDWRIVKYEKNTV